MPLGVCPLQINICMYIKRHAFAVAWLGNNWWPKYDELLACHLQISPWFGGRENLCRVTGQETALNRLRDCHSGHRQKIDSLPRRFSTSHVPSLTSTLPCSETVALSRSSRLYTRSALTDWELIK